MSDFIIQQGTDAAFTWPLQNEDGTAFDDSGWNAVMEVRSHRGTLLHTFSSATANLNFGAGFLFAVWTANETKNWDWSGGRYDLCLYRDTETIRIDAGYIQISKAVTQR